MSKEVKEQKEDKIINNDCFIIMPIADPENYDKGHFNKVYEDIFKVSCQKAGFCPVRADEVKQTNLIHLDILQKLIDSPMAICDLSNRNPNVLFELGLRQAFDKPTVLVQEIGTPKIFDISPLRYTEYRKELKYREVLEDQESIATALTATKEATDKGEGVNSIISLLSLSNPASLKDVTDNDSAKMLQIVMSEMNDLRMDFRNGMRRFNEMGLERRALNPNDPHLMEFYEYNRMKSLYDQLNDLAENNAPIEDIHHNHELLIKRAMRLLKNSTDSVQRNTIKSILIEADRILATSAAKGQSKN